VNGVEEIFERLLFALVILILFAQILYLFIDHIVRKERDWRDDEPTEYEDRRFRGRR